MTTKMHMRCEAMTLVAIGKIILTKEAVRWMVQCAKQSAYGGGWGGWMGQTKTGLSPKGHEQTAVHVPFV